MITKIEKAVLLCIDAKKWEMKDKKTSGVSYNALVYSEKSVIPCKADLELYERLKDREVIKGTAVIEIKTTNYNEKEKIVYQLREFGETK